MKESTKQGILLFLLKVVLIVVVIIVTKLICPSMPDWGLYLFIFIFAISMSIFEAVSDLEDKIDELKDMQR